MSARLRLTLAFALVTGCAGGPVRVRGTPGEALVRAEARLAERGVGLDAAGRTPARVRTARYCYQPADAQGFDWNRSFARPLTAPPVQVYEGDIAAQDAERARCAYAFRVELVAEADVSGQARLVPTAEWWRKTQRSCAPQGDPLLGVVRCEYGYDGALAPDNIEGFIAGMLSGL